MKFEVALLVSNDIASVDEENIVVVPYKQRKTRDEQMEGKPGTTRLEW